MFWVKLLLFCCSKNAIIANVPRGGAAWSARLAHNQEVVGSNPTPATKKDASAMERLFLFSFVDYCQRRS